ncbi:hypothetical protein HanRHA438_Chr02g0086441 [Helianthus annuus]|nr:hypothetical protein HanRHA438_Chr02g0086441 [Helianthus annuus]
MFLIFWVLMMKKKKKKKQKKKKKKKKTSFDKRSLKEKFHVDFHDLRFSTRSKQYE